LVRFRASRAAPGAHPEVFLAAAAQHPGGDAERCADFGNAKKRLHLDQTFKPGENAPMPMCALILIQQRRRQALDQGVDQEATQAVRSRTEIADGEGGAAIQFRQNLWWSPRAG
jgi:hypothetical protein